MKLNIFSAHLRRHRTKGICLISFEIAQNVCSDSKHESKLLIELLQMLCLIVLILIALEQMLRLTGTDCISNHYYVTLLLGRPASAMQ